MNIKFKTLLALLVCLTVFQIGVNGQNSPKHTLSLNYLGESYTHPGASIWYDYLIFEKRKDRTTRKGKEKTHITQFKSHNRVGFYHFPRHHNGWLHTTGLLVQHLNKKGTLVGVSLVGGYQTTFLNEDTYQVSNTGTVEQLGWSSSTNVVLGFNTKLGKEYFYKNNNQRWGWHISSSLYWIKPFAFNSQLLPTIEIGTSYKI